MISENTCLSEKCRWHDFESILDKITAVFLLMLEHMYSFPYIFSSLMFRLSVHISTASFNGIV